MTQVLTPTKGRMAEKVALGAITGGAVAIAVVEAVLLVMRVIDLATAKAITLTGVTTGEVAAQDVTAASDRITSASFESLTMTVEGLPASARGDLIAAAILTALLTIGICAVVAWLCLLVFVGQPFVRSATWGIGVAAVLVMLAGLGAPFLTALAHAETVSALSLEGAGLPLLMFEIDLAPLGWGLALAVVAGAFELGQRMQRDTKGLV